MSGTLWYAAEPTRGSLDSAAAGLAASTLRAAATRAGNCCQSRSGPSYAKGAAAAEYQKTALWGWGVSCTLRISLLRTRVDDAASRTTPGISTPSTL